ncbi:MAG TPA: GAF domain-containing protein, partial [Methanobacterium sp.]|nr:GAF domain-containing protein [Methanobacterium sp.]
MNKTLKLLIIEDSPTDADLVELEFVDEGIELSSKIVETREDFIKELTEFEPELVLSDYNLPNFDGLSALEIKKEIAPDIPFIMVSGAIGEELAVETLKRGATDYVLKDNLIKLIPVVKRALKEAEEYSKRKIAEKKLKEYYDTLEETVEIRTKELQVANEELRVTTDELRVANEELQTTAIQLHTSNKELRSTTEELNVANEELEVSNEELKATTDELQIANEELRNQRETLVRLNRTLRALSHSDYIMIHAENEATYLNDVCKIIMEDCGYTMVWIGFTEEDENKTVRPVAQCGFDEGYVENLNITWADTERGRGPTGTAVRTGRPYICRNMLTDPNFEPWRADAIERGYASSIVVPLMADNKKLGAISIYSTEPDSFLDEEVKLLEELANDLAFGITNLRLQIAHEKAGIELAESEERYRLILETANSGVFLLDTENNFKYINHRMIEILGYSANEMLDVNLTQFTDTKGQKNIFKFMDEWRKGKNRLNEFRFVCKDGSIFWALLAASPI